MTADQARNGIGEYARAHGIAIGGVNSRWYEGSVAYEVSVTYHFPGDVRRRNVTTHEMNINVAYQKAYEKFIMWHLLFIHGVQPGNELPSYVYEHYRLVWLHAEHLANNDIVYDTTP